MTSILTRPVEVMSTDRPLPVRSVMVHSPALSPVKVSLQRQRPLTSSGSSHISSPFTSLTTTEESRSEPVFAVASMFILDSNGLTEKLKSGLALPEICPVHVAKSMIFSNFSERSKPLAKTASDLVEHDSLPSKVLSM